MSNKGIQPCTYCLCFSNLKNSFIVPCGACRQFMAEVIKVCFFLLNIVWCDTINLHAYPGQRLL